MAKNPWNVNSIQDFRYLNCPECHFKVKNEQIFQNHAMKNHPLSSIFFDGIIKMEILEGISTHGKTPDTQIGPKMFEPKMIDPSKIQLNMNFSKSELKTVFDVLTLIANSRPKSSKKEKTLEEIMYPDLNIGQTSQVSRV